MGKAMRCGNGKRTQLGTLRRWQGQKEVPGTASVCALVHKKHSSLVSPLAFLETTGAAARLIPC